jgi:hypothetical protein
MERDLDFMGVLPWAAQWRRARPVSRASQNFNLWLGSQRRGGPAAKAASGIAVRATAVPYAKGCPDKPLCVCSRMTRAAWWCGGPLKLQGRLHVAPPVNRILVIVATVGMFAFVAAIVGGAFRPPVYSLAGKP